MITELIPTAKEHVNYIKERVPMPDLYEQLAEEAAELSQAANKMARYLRGVNPTPKDRARGPQQPGRGVYARCECGLQHTGYSS